ncbi:MAG TPA: thiamine pyrophosphokinase [Sphingobacteriaceae bacterium]|nr:thiamine pyrophosphokinase [Sphingobacteriaceae bacterium]
MSSHHIVREKQEPALLILNLDQFDQEYLGQLLEWSPTIIVSGPVYEKADSLGIKIDVVITSDPGFSPQESTLIIPAGDTLLEDALKFLVGEQYPSVNIITSEFALKDYAMYVDRIDLVIYMGDKKIFPVRSGFSKWCAAGENVLLLQEVNNLHTSGLQLINHHTLQTEKDGFYTLTFDHSFIFIAETI